MSTGPANPIGVGATARPSGTHLVGGGAGNGGWRLGHTMGALVLAGALAVVGACGADDNAGSQGASALVKGDTTVVVANSPGVISTNGPQRVMVALVGSTPNEFLGGPDKPATIEFHSPDTSVTADETGQWLTATGNTLGLYVTHYTFPTAGTWEVRLKGTSGAAALATINVAEKASVPDRGDPAPPSQTLTGAKAATLADISTDPTPDPRFYQLAVADAVKSGKPSVIVFATPAFCQTALCGPTLDIAKKVAATHPGIQFVHVEPYDIPKAQAGQLVPIDAMAEWHLQTEPWVFVVGADGKVVTSFEGIMGEDELATALTGL